MTSRAFILLLLLAALAQSVVTAAAQQHQHDQAISTASSSSSSSSTSPLLSLLILCLIMTISTFFMGALPLFINLSHLQMILLQSLAAGLLLGAGITIVLPEGVANLYAHKPHSSSSSKSKHSEYDPEHALGISVLVGFLLMYFVDRIFSSQHHHFQHHPHSSQSSQPHQQHQQPPPTSYSSSSAAASSSSSGGTPLRIAGFRLFFRGMSRTGSHEDGSLAGFSRASLTSLLGLVIHAFTDGIAMGATSLTSAAQLQQQVDATTSPTTLHVRHSDMAAQDSSDPASSLRLIVFLAIMLHKAPAALGLSTLLLSQGGSRLAILRAVALFALSTPIGALVTYGLGYWVLENGVVAAAAGGGGTGPINGGTIPPLDSRLVVRVATSLLAVTSRDAGGHGNDDHGAAAPPPPGGLSSKHIGIALTFSAGTFLYVAMHALGELMGGTPHPRPASSSEQGHHLRSRHSQQQRQGRQQHTGYDSVRGHDDDDDDEQDGASVDDEERRRRRWKRYDEEDPAIFDVEHENGGGGGGGGNNKREPHNPPSSSSSSVMGETKPRTRITSGGDHHHAAINGSSDSSESPPPGRNARSGPEHERNSGKTPLGLELVKTALLLIGTATPRFLQGLTGGHGH
ncbi:hypothetical protein OC861_004951 [Tilletia horrida]|nr:hypothetical protein OC861_004951 [Tilletia horrida]